jgi:S-adenosylmethionine:tRNA ribosyltransferase-isomerase
MEKFDLKDYDYGFPKELIAQSPAEKRGSSRMMVLDRKNGAIKNSLFSSITDFFSPGDCIVINNTRVLPANIEGFSGKNKSRISILVLEHLSGNCWEVLMKNSRRVEEGDSVEFDGGIKLIVKKKKGRSVEVEFNFGKDELIKKLKISGSMPLPPYIKNDLKNRIHRERYQTVYASEDGAKAAPTAGLHFTPEILSKLENNGVEIAPVTLHVGIGTFASIESSDIREHRIHSETMEVSPGSAQKINLARASGKKITAVGTTSMRVLESVCGENGVIKNFSGSTDIYIYPGYKFKAVDMLLTNFHLPKTSLLVLVSAFGGYDNIKKAYAEAIREKYRLFSYGDAMLIK